MTADRPFQTPALNAVPRAGVIGRRAIALVEVVVSIGILGGLMAAVLNAVAAAAGSRTKTLERLQGAALAESLMAEVMSAKYTNPAAPTAVISVDILVLGINVTLKAPGGNPSRAALDAIDDYDGWDASPPLACDGTVIPGYTGWGQLVRVEDAPLNSPGGPDANADTGIKRITVIITRNGREISRMVSLRSLAWEGALDAR